MLHQLGVESYTLSITLATRFNTVACCSSHALTSLEVKDTKFDCKIVFGVSRERERLHQFPQLRRDRLRSTIAQPRRKSLQWNTRFALKNFQRWTFVRAQSAHVRTQFRLNESRPAVDYPCARHPTESYLPNATKADAAPFAAQQCSHVYGRAEGARATLRGAAARARGAPRPFSAPSPASCRCASPSARCADMRDARRLLPNR